MGAWGCESSANDNTMDILVEYCKNTSNPTQKEADKCLENVFDPSEGYASSLGLVVWFLQKGLHVDKNILLQSIEKIDYDYAENTDGWFNFDERRQCLLLEKEIIESALDNQGVAKKKFAKPVGDILSMGLGAIHKGNSLVPTDN